MGVYTRSGWLLGIQEHAGVRNNDLLICCNSHIVHLNTAGIRDMSKLIFSKDQNQAKKLSRLCQQKQIRRICRGVYTDNLTDPLADIVAKNWIPLVSHIVSNGILSYRTAVELRPIPFKDQTIVFLTSTYTKTINLPGLIIKVIKGNNTSHLEQVLPGIARSNQPRMLLENLAATRGASYKNIKTIGETGVEKILAKELRLRNEASLNQIRDAAKAVAAELGYSTEYKKLNAIISALLVTHPDPNVLQSKYAKAIAEQRPFDNIRLQMFEQLSIYIKRCDFLTREYQYSKVSFKNLTFFESYFSNFIEGTEFIIDEAEDIVFQGKEIHQRHADSHDVLANFTISNDYSEMTVTPQSAKELMELLQNRHAYLMQARPDIHPGQFKQIANKVGNTYFVAPEEVIGTLVQGFELYNIMKDGLEKALFMHLLISEVHPFDDGNGRLSRIMMNAELVKAGLYKIIIHSVHRDNYLNGLRLASRDNNFRSYCKAMDQAQAYTASVNWLDYGEARTKIETDHANQKADEGLPIFNRALRQLVLSEFAV